jgi:hypothetical protein
MFEEVSSGGERDAAPSTVLAEAASVVTVDEAIICQEDGIMYIECKSPTCGKSRQVSKEEWEAYKQGPREGGNPMCIHFGRSCDEPHDPLPAYEVPTAMMGLVTTAKNSMNSKASGDMQLLTADESDVIAALEQSINTRRSAVQHEKGVSAEAELFRYPACFLTRNATKAEKESPAAAKAWEKEIGNFRKHEVWDSEPVSRDSLPAKARIYPLLGLTGVKHAERTSEEHVVKARLVGRGDIGQHPDGNPVTDTDEVWAPVASLASVRLVMALSLILDRPAQ